MRSSQKSVYQVYRNKYNVVFLYIRIYLITGLGLSIDVFMFEVYSITNTASLISV